MRLKLIVIVAIILLLPVINMVHAHDYESSTHIVHGLGLILKQPNSSKIVSVIKPTGNAPDARTVSKVDNSEYLPPIGDQGAENSCVGWAIGYYLMGYQEIKEHGWNKYDSEHWMSPYFVYNLINGGFDNGSFLSDAAHLLINVGDSPYNDFESSNYYQWPGKKAFFEASKYRASDYHWIQGVNNLRQLLANGKVAVISIYVWDNFIDINNYGNVYTVADLSGYNHGGHAVVVVGYDDNKYTKDGYGAFKLANSWGVGWGDHGFFWMSYKAFLTSYVCTGWAMYLDYRADYMPKTVVALKINHASRGDIMRYGITIGFKNESEKFLYFPYIYSYLHGKGLGDEYQQHPFPDDYMVFDVTGIAPNLSFGNEIYITLNDSIPGNTGIINSVELYYLPAKSSTEHVCNEIIPDNGENVTVYVRIRQGFHTRIKIIGDDDFYELNGVFRGKGDVANPYVIDNCTVDADGSNYGIIIEFTTSTFIIRNSTILNASTGNIYEESVGIYLMFVQNGYVENNTIRNVDTGIILYSSRNVVLSGNIIYGRFRGIYVTGNFNNKIDRNNTVNGFPVYYYYNLKNFNIENLKVGDVTIVECSKFEIKNVEMVNGDGIRIINSVDGHISDFEINSSIGVEVNRSTSIIIEDGSVNNSLIHGGVQVYSSTIVKIINVKVSESYNGFYIKYSDNVTIKNSKGMRNTYNGVYQLDSSVEIKNCEFGDNTIDGIHIMNSEYTNIENSHIYDNQRYGIMIYRSDNITVSGNKIENNSDYGVYLSSSRGCVIYYNFFYFNRDSNKTFNMSHVQAYDDGNNSWNSSKIGNYWNDWIKEDKNHDGIVDKPYPIDGPSHNFDYKPIRIYPQSNNLIFYLSLVSAIVVIGIILLIIRRKKLMGKGNKGEVKNMYAVFRFEKGDKKIDEIFKDDLLSRQTLIKRDGKSLGLDDDFIYLIVEGSEDAIAKVRTLAGDCELKKEEEDDIYRRIKESEDEASAGLGAIFG